MIDIRLPNITGRTEAEQLTQIKSYLYQFAEQLQWALSTVQTGNGSNVVIQKNGTGSASTKTEDVLANFSAMKGLIIKSADIVNAYYDEIYKRLEGEYEAISDYGSFKEKTELNIEANSRNICEYYQNMQEISNTVDHLYDATVQTEAYLKTGLLYYDTNSVPVYGLEIGQTNEVNGEKYFNKYARFTSDRLSFYDANDTEVAYISDYMLVITNARIKGSLKLGDFEFDTSNGLALIPI
jgi:hypothetical protein